MKDPGSLMEQEEHDRAIGRAYDVADEITTRLLVDSHWLKPGGLISIGTALIQVDRICGGQVQLTVRSPLLEFRFVDAPKKSESLDCRCQAGEG